SGAAGNYQIMSDMDVLNHGQITEHILHIALFSGIFELFNCFIISSLMEMRMKILNISLFGIGETGSKNNRGPCHAGL
ncbi:MAG: hypothetical protein MUD09_08480, partial [Desulfobacterales bacterium]|nr:hypothetical protein [Desulfobacterales bacterium]